jgi:hypothetical protein
MHFKRNIVDHFNDLGIDKYILIGENILNFHGSDDSYYEEWFQNMEEGWICGINFRDFVIEEMSQYNIDSYLIFGGELDEFNWRTMTPRQLFEKINLIVSRRIDLL